MADQLETRRGRREFFRRRRRRRHLVHRDDRRAPLLLRGNFITVSSVMIDKALFEQSGGFYHQKGGCEDWDLWLRVSGQSQPISYVSEPLVRYRFTPTSMSAPSPA